MTLSEIQKKVNERLDVRKKTISQNQISQTLKPKQCLSAVSIFPKNSINIIAEFKKASPTEGDIAPHADAVTTAKEYFTCGAKALSILTEPDFFKGNLNYILQIKKTLPKAFVLMKDFIFDEYQILEGAAAGADAILLIVAMLKKSQLRDLIGYTKYWGLNPLVEVHSKEEMEVALEVGATFIGVNNRNLKTMKIDLDISKKLAPYKKQISVLISESGFTMGSQLKMLSEIGYDGFLMGTQFMKAPSPGKRLAEILTEAQSD